MTDQLNKIRNAIEEAGWYEGRKIDIAYMIDDYTRHGFTNPNELVQSFLSEYGNIRIEFKNETGFWSDIRINPEMGMGFLESEHVGELEKLIGEPVLPVGGIHTDLAGLLISFSGNFYLLGADGIYFLGSDLLTTCECVFLRKPLVKLAEIKG